MEKARLKDIGTIVTGNTPSKKKSEYYIDKDICFFKPSDIEDYGVTKLKKSEEYISEKARNKVRMLPKKSVLVTCIGTIGKVGIIEKEACCNQQINAIIPKDNINSKYLAYAVLSKKYWLQKKANAPVVPIINKSDFSNVEIFIHNIEEQNVIVNQLDKIQEIIDLRKKQIEKLDELTKSQFVELFGDPIENPKNYKIVKLSDIADYWNGLTYKPTDVNKKGAIVLRSSNIKNSQLDYQDIVRVNCNIKEKQYVEDNDILMCSRNGSARLVGKVAVIKNIKEKMTFGAFMMIIRSEYYPYLFSYFQTDAFRNQIKSGATTTINQITGNMLNKIKLPLPDKKDINQFAEIIKQINNQKFILEKSLKETEELQESLMNKYFGE